MPLQHPTRKLRLSGLPLDLVLGSRLLLLLCPASCAEFQVLEGRSRLLCRSRRSALCLVAFVRLTSAQRLNFSRTSVSPQAAKQKTRPDIPARLSPFTRRALNPEKIDRRRSREALAENHGGEMAGRAIEESPAGAAGVASGDSFGRSSLSVSGFWVDLQQAVNLNLALPLKRPSSLTGDLACCATVRSKAPEAINISLLLTFSPAAPPPPPPAARLQAGRVSTPVDVPSQPLGVPDFEKCASLKEKGWGIPSPCSYQEAHRRTPVALKPREKVLVDWRGYKTAFIPSLLPSCFSDPAFSPPEQLGLKLTGGRLGDGSFWGNPDPWPTPGPVGCRAALDVGARKGRKGSGGGPSWKAPLLLEEFNSRQLSRRLGLGDQRVKLWFQNWREDVEVTAETC